MVKPGLQDAPRAWNPKQRLRGHPTEQQRESKGRRELYAGGDGLIEEGELRPQNKDIMDEIDRIGAARERIHPGAARADNAPKQGEEAETTRNATDHP